MAEPSQPRQLLQLTKAEEERLLKEMKKRALAKCDSYVKALSDCTRDRGVSVAWACRAQNREVNECLHQYTRAEDYDAIKLEYMHERRPDLLQARPLPTKPLSSR